MEVNQIQNSQLNPSIVIERRRGLEWVVSDETDWYEMDMPA